MRTVVSADWLWNCDQLLANPVLELEDRHIHSITTRSERELPTHTQQLHYPGAILAPSFFDVHIHGAAGHDVMEATPNALHAVSRFLASRGTGSFLATTVTAPLDATLRSIEGLAKLLRKSDWHGATPLGIHLEGPFLSHAKRGVHPPEHLLAPSIPVFDRLYEAAEGNLRLMTLAPELPDAAQFAVHAVARGVRVSVGHSNATAAETRKILHAGATSATHTFNAMRPLDHREPGILGVTLTTDSLFAELICDGIHVDPALVRLWWRMKGRERGILITDAMAATGMPDGEYRLGDFSVQVANGRATANDVLAGSVLTLDKALVNFLAFTGATPAEALPLLTQNPAAMTGLGARAGSLKVGDPANLVAIAPDGALLASIIAGKPVSR
uniref:N-acetylglucosamine 6-phosphate deacetylase n=1 Tax=mine drainage metagenome TaxID=410659 RepID=E6QMH6_9ZZZZ